MTSTTTKPRPAVQTPCTGQPDALQTDLDTILHRAIANLSTCKYLYRGHIQGAIDAETFKAKIPALTVEEMAAAVTRVEAALRLMWE